MKCNINLSAMKKKVIALIIICFGGISSHAQFYNLSTGIGWGPGNPDPNWTVQQTAPNNIQLGNPIVITPPVVGGGNPQFPVGPCGGWVAPGGNLTNSTFMYTNVFVAAPMTCGATATLDLTYLGADDNVTQIIFNGATIWAGTDFNFTNLPNGTGLWSLTGIPVTLSTSGPNTLQIIVNNGFGASSLRVCGGITVSTPWPQTTMNSSEGDITNDVCDGQSRKCICNRDICSDNHT